MNKTNKTLTAFKGVKVGHSTHLGKLTGCTVVLFDNPPVTACKVYGGAPGSFNVARLTNGKSFNRCHGLFIAGGSNNGLMSGGEIMRCMIERKIGFKTYNILNPSVCGAIVLDLGTRIAQYDPKYAREAFENADNKPVARGNVGAGTGTSVGKFQYLENGTKFGGMKSGVGSSRVDLPNGVMVCALSVVNAVGNVVGRDGSILAGNRDEKKKFKTFKDTMNFVTSDVSNTTITIVGTNVDLKTRENLERVAHFGALGQARAIKPAHTSIDGDTVFAFSTEEIKTPLNSFGKYFETPAWPYFTVDIIGQLAEEAVQESIYDACNQAETIKFPGAYKGIVPSAKDYK